MHLRFQSLLMGKLKVKNSSCTLFCQWADKYLNFEKTPVKNVFWLETMKFLMGKLGNPQESYRSFHVAGSKGKGSISAFINSILWQHGKKAGLYGSPHILDFEERITDGKKFLSEEIYSKSFKELKQTVESIDQREFPEQRPLTWFELATAFGMVCFKNAGYDFSVFEVGLGGRLDATNIINPVCSCIGPIELEHAEFLGDTVEKIAAEKGGIIKNGVPVVISPQTETVRDVFVRIGRERNSPVYFADDLCSISGIRYVDYQSEVGMTNDGLSARSGSKRRMCFSLSSKLFSRPLNLNLRMFGSFQAWNAAVAAISIRLVLPEISEETIEKGLSTAFLPGRFETDVKTQRYDNVKNLVLDGSHTPKSIGFGLETLDAVYGNAPFTLLFGCAADKDVEDIARLMTGRFESVFLTKPGEVKKADTERMEKAFKNCGIPCDLNEDYTSQISKALDHADKKGTGLYVCGSFYLVSEVKKLIESWNRV